MKLRVEQARKEDLYRDFARIPECQRIDGKGKAYKENRIYRFSKKGAWRRRAWLIMMGNQRSNENSILLDEITRKKLGVQLGELVEFKICRAPLLGALCFARHASETAYRLSITLAISSVIISGIALGVAFLLH